jgi:hypothetical protein
MEAQQAGYLCSRNTASQYSPLAGAELALKLSRFSEFALFVKIVQVNYYVGDEVGYPGDDTVGADCKGTAGGER